MGEKNKIREKISLLDNSFPLKQYDKEEIWEGIEGRIKKGKVRHIFIRYSSIAASILILAFFLLKAINGDPEIYTQTQEVVTQSYDEPSDDTAIEAEAIEFIQNSCLAHQSICESEEFKTLRMELDQLDEEIDQLNEMISQYGKDELLIKSKIKIENHKSEVTRKLVQILMT